MTPVPVEIVGVHVDPDSMTSIVLLGEPGEAMRVLPIFVGPAEAQAIVLGASGVATPRPMTHDLMVDVIARLGATVTAVEVTALVDGTFHADLVLETGSGPERVSSRPSDGIALAVRLDVPISVWSAVLDEAAVEVTHEVGEGFTDDEIESIVGEFQEFLATASPEDFVEPGPGDEPDEAGPTDEPPPSDD